MYKSFILTVVFCCMFLVVSSLPAEGAQNGGITYSVGYQKIPGKSFQGEWTLNYVAGVLKTDAVANLEDDMGLSCYMLRISKMVPLLVNKKLEGGIEVGYGLPLKSYSKEWFLPSNMTASPLNKEYTYANDGGTIYSNSYYKQSYKEEATVTAVPLLARMAYNIPMGDKIGLKVGLGAGSYIMNVKQKQTTTKTYTDSSSVSEYKTGDVVVTTATNDNTLILPAAEFVVSGDYKLSDNMSFEFGGNLSMLGKRGQTEENPALSDPNGMTADPVKSSVKRGIELGGTAFGMNAGLVLNF